MRNTCIVMYFNLQTHFIQLSVPFLFPASGFSAKMARVLFKQEMVLNSGNLPLWLLIHLWLSSAHRNVTGCTMFCFEKLGFGSSRDLSFGC